MLYLYQMRLSSYASSLRNDVLSHSENVPPVMDCRSEPARSTRVNLEVRSMLASLRLCRHWGDDVVTNIATRWCPQTIAKLVQITPITMVYRFQWEFQDDVVTNIAIMELMAVDGVVAIEIFSDMDMTWPNWGDDVVMTNIAIENGHGNIQESSHTILSWFSGI